MSRLFAVLTILSLLALNCVSVDSMAQDFNVSRIEARLLITDPSCEKLQRIAAALSQWALVRRDRHRCPSPRLQGNEICALDISDCVPNQIFQLQGVLPKFQGPNCWNSALMLAGVLPAARFVTQEEMTFYMGSPLCRQLSEHESKRPGDIGAIRTNSQSFVEMHGFAYLSEDIVFTRNGLSADPRDMAQYTLSSLEAVLALPYMSVPLECRGNSLMDASCKNKLEYFRCESFNNFLKKSKNIPREIVSFLERLNLLEEQLGRQLLSSDIVVNVSELLETTANLTDYLKKQLEINPTLGMAKRQRSFLLGIVDQGLISIHQQFRAAAFIGRIQELERDILALRTMSFSFVGLPSKQILLTHLTSAPEYLRKEAADLLMHYTLDDQDVEALALFADFPSMAGVSGPASRRLLARIGTPKAKTVLENVLRSPNPDARSDAERYLGRPSQQGSHFEIESLIYDASDGRLSSD